MYVASADAVSTLTMVGDGANLALKAAGKAGEEILAKAATKELTQQVEKKVVEEVAEKGVTVLGKFPDYLNLASKIKAKAFNIPLDIWNKMTEAEQWAANQKFLDRLIKRGDRIVLSNPVTDINKVSGSFREELDYLIGKGYHLNSSGTELIK